jgi:hypothetical protein
MTLLGKVLPTQLTGEGGGPIATDNAHHGEVAVSDTVAFITEALGSRADASIWQISAALTSTSCCATSSRPLRRQRLGVRPLPRGAGRPNGYLDSGAREHFKSTIITYALTIQDVLNDPETTVGIFSHTRPIAKGFLRQIKREFESNEDLKRLYPDVLWAESPQGVAEVVGRRRHHRQAQVQPEGMHDRGMGPVDGQPTSKHYKLAVYDDTVTRESVTTPEMIKKVTEAWELSLNLHSEGGVARYIGTRYHFNDTYATMIARGSVKPRIYPATENGKVDGKCRCCSPRSAWR